MPTTVLIHLIFAFPLLFSFPLWFPPLQTKLPFQLSLRSLSSPQTPKDPPTILPTSSLFFSFLLYLSLSIFLLKRLDFCLAFSCPFPFIIILPPKIKTKTALRLRENYLQDNYPDYCSDYYPNY